MNELLNKLIMYHQIHQMSRDGWKVARIASFLGLNWRTVSKYLGMSEQEFLEYQEVIKYRTSELDPFEGFVKIKLEKYPQTSAAQMHDWLKEHYKHFPELAPKTVYNFVMRVRQEHNIPKTGKQRDFCIVEEQPYGKQAQIDFGEYNMRDSKGKRVKVYFFSMVLSRSRYKYIYFSPAPFTSSLAVHSHQKAFEYFEGIPQELVYDQDSLFLTRENKGDLILAQAFQSYCKAMPFKLYFCRKADPQSKGKIENVIKYVKQNFLYNRPFVDISTLNREALGWLLRTANGMPHAITGKKPKDQWEVEKNHLTAFTAYSFTGANTTYPVRQDNAVYYKSNLYSLPEGTFRGRGTEVTMTVTDDKLFIKDLLGNQIAVHLICLEKGRVIVNTDHRRDKSKTIDNLLLEVAMTFPDYDKALLFLEKIRKEKKRYARDQFMAIRKAVSRADPQSVLKTLIYCIDNTIHNASDFEAVMDKYIRENKQNNNPPATPVKPGPLSLNRKISEVIPNTSNIIDYEKIMKN
ncbi:MAG: IS21 family transposase [Desulfobacterales bacterium]|nr:IS21 family transposase [Desulfobacterales bacterium]